MDNRQAPQELLERYLRAKRRVTPEFVDGLGIERMGLLPEKERTVLTYMMDIEAAVDSSYYPAADAAPTGSNPVIAQFLVQWKEEEGRHAALLDRILAASGGATPRTVLEPSNTGWITRLMGERLFGGVHMALGAANELMAGHAYRELAKLTDNEVLQEALLAIGAEEAIHYSFYRGMAQYYLSRSRLGRFLTLRVMNRVCVGVGVGIRSEDDAHEVVRTIFRGNHDEFSEKVGSRIRRLPGLGSFTRLEEMFAQAHA